jgi:2-polyprenyl-3-methyl-5-hydroxy-6-metoxy-1,4-benzoquinol methylase
MNKDQIFSSIKKAGKSQKRIKIPELCTQRSVLDVGCIGQDNDYNSPDWMHNLIRNVTGKLDGVDINQEGIAFLKEKGYNVYSVDELKATNNKYEVIVMSDVIEHVNDPVDFLKFYSFFLSENGILVITTPNAHGIRNFTSILIRNNYSVNSEHTVWLCPKTMLEIIERADLKFAGFYWLREYFTLKDVKDIKFKIIYLVNRFFEKLRSNFYPNFMFIISK